MMFTVEKQPAEIIPVTINFVRLLPAGETLGNNCSVTALDINGNNASNNIIVTSLAASPYLTATVTGGNNSEVYSLSFKGITTPGNYVFEEDVVLKIVEKKI